MSTASLSRSESTDRENAALRRLVSAFQHLSSLAVLDSGLESVTESIAARVDTVVAVVDEKLTVLACSGGSTSDAAQFFRNRLSHPRLSQLLEVVGPMRRALRVPEIDGMAPMIVAPVPVGETIPAYLLTLDDGATDEFDDMRLLLTEHAATICGVILGRDRVVVAAATRARADLVEGLLSGKGSSAEELKRWAAHLGYDEQLEHRVVTLIVHGTEDDEHPTRVAENVEKFFLAHAPRAITALRGHEVVAVVSEGGPHGLSALEIARLCARQLNETINGARIVAGVGGVCRSALEVARSYNDARRTAEFIDRMGRTGVVVPVEDLGIHRLLLHIADAAQLREFAQEVFGSLLTQGNGAAMDNLSTLACYFRENNSPQRAAQALHLHRNTVTYRVRRIEEVTDLNFANYRDRLMAQVALEILDLIDIEDGTL